MGSCRTSGSPLPEQAADAGRRAPARPRALHSPFEQVPPCRNGYNKVSRQEETDPSFGSCLSQNRPRFMWRKMGVTLISANWGRRCDLSERFLRGLDL